MEDETLDHLVRVIVSPAVYPRFHFIHFSLFQFVLVESNLEPSIWMPFSRCKLFKFCIHVHFWWQYAKIQSQIYINHVKISLFLCHFPDLKTKLYDFFSLSFSSTVSKYRLNLAQANCTQTNFLLFFYFCEFRSNSDRINREPKFT